MRDASWIGGIVEYPTWRGNFHEAAADPSRHHGQQSTTDRIRPGIWLSRQPKIVYTWTPWTKPSGRNVAAAISDDWSPGSRYDARKCQVAQ